MLGWLRLGYVRLGLARLFMSGSEEPYLMTEYLFGVEWMTLVRNVMIGTYRRQVGSVSD